MTVGGVAQWHTRLKFNNNLPTKWYLHFYIFIYLYIYHYKIYAQLNVVLTTGVKWSTLEQANYAPQMPIYLMYLNEPKWRRADPSNAKLNVCSITLRPKYIWQLLTEVESVNSFLYSCNMKSITIKYSLIAHIFYWCLEQRFLIKLLHVVYLILMAVPSNTLTNIVNSSYIYKMYYFTILLKQWRYFGIKIQLR
jgi:hypothetical protein